ncbi:MAG: PfkB family carbohydrate kinase [Anaerolineae bacterium]|nr:PfkB family carbohydrate kinase [Anaerolineae bacterium]
MDHATPIDYLLIGHITRDLGPHGPVLGGTASYSALTAKAFGLRVGLLTSAHPDEPLLKGSALDGIEVTCVPALATTTFTNIYEGGHRRQILNARARRIVVQDVPRAWSSSPIVHLGPLTQEVDREMIKRFPGAFVGVTPQGWLRQWDSDGVVSMCCWDEAADILPLATTAVLSREDVHGDLSLIEMYARLAPLLVVTRGVEGADVYLGGAVHHVTTHRVEEVDPTGAGDIFAAAFFAWLHRKRDPIEAARLACYIATMSITRPGLAGVPTPEEVAAALEALGVKE